METFSTPAALTTDELGTYAAIAVINKEVEGYRMSMAPNGDPSPSHGASPAKQLVHDIPTRER